MKEALQNFLTEIKGNNRLRIGIWLILLTALFYGLLAVHEKNTELQHQYTEYQQTIQRLQEVNGEEEWHQRAAATEKAYTDELAHFPVIKTMGLARAGVENTLSELLASIGIEKKRLRIDQFNEIADSPGILQLTTRISGMFDIGQFAQLLYDLEKQEQRSEVIQLTVTIGKRARFELIYAFYFQSSEDTGRATL